MIGQRIVKLAASSLLRLRRLDVLLGSAFLGLVALVIAWEWLRGSAASNYVEQSDGEIVCHIGDVAPGSKSSRKVPIRNQTSSPLTVKAVSRSCSCLVVGLDCNTIPPGGVANLTVEFLSPKRQGGFRHSLIVRFAEDQEPIIIRLYGTVSAWIRSSVPILEFADTFPGETNRRHLRLQVLEPWPEEQRRIKSLMPYTRIESASAEDDGKTVVYMIVFQPPANAASKEYEGDLVVEWIGHEDRGFKLPCKGKVTAEWIADPPQVVLGRVALKQPPTFTIQIRNQRHTDEAWRRRYKVAADSSGLLDISSTWDGGRWRATGSVREKGLLRPGVKSATLCVTASDGSVPFRVPVYWEAEQR